VVLRAPFPLVPLALLAALGGCAQSPPAEPRSGIAAPPVGFSTAALTATVTVTAQAASLAGTSAEDDVRNLPYFLRLDGVYHALRRLRGADQDGDVVGKDAPEDARAIVQAQSGATSLAVFSAVATCAYAGFRHVGLRWQDGPILDGEFFVIDHAGHPVNARATGTVLKLRLRSDGVDVAWHAKGPCAKLPAAGQTTLSELEAWADRACPAGDAGCFDLALLNVDPRVPVGDVAHTLATLARHVTGPLLYSVLVYADATVPEQRCEDTP
jgi:hypothetical protein